MLHCPRPCILAGRYLCGPPEGRRNTATMRRTGWRGENRPVNAGRGSRWRNPRVTHFIPVGIWLALPAPVSTGRYSRATTNRHPAEKPRHPHTVTVLPNINVVASGPVFTGFTECKEVLLAHEKKNLCYCYMAVF